MRTITQKAAPRDFGDWMKNQRGPGSKDPAPAPAGPSSPKKFISQSVGMTKDDLLETMENYIEADFDGWEDLELDEDKLTDDLCQEAVDAYFEQSYYSLGDSDDSVAQALARSLLPTAKKIAKD